VLDTSHTDRHVCETGQCCERMWTNFRQTNYKKINHVIFSLNSELAVYKLCINKYFKCQCYFDGKEENRNEEKEKKNRSASVYLWYMTAQDPSFSPFLIFLSLLFFLRWFSPSLGFNWSAGLFQWLREWSWHDSFLLWK